MEFLTIKRHLGSRMILGTIAVLLLTYGCKKEEVTVRDFPRVLTHQTNHITPTGATLNAELLSLGAENIIDHGFYYSDQEMMRENDCEKISLGPTRMTGSFDHRLKVHLEKDKTYYVKAFVFTADKITLGPTLSFMAHGSGSPYVESFEPEICLPADTIRVTGSGFSRLGDRMEVIMADLANQIITCSDSVFFFIVNENIPSGSYQPQINIYHHQVIPEQSLKISQLEIIDFSPKIGEMDDTLTISVKNIFPDPNRIQTTIGKINAHIIHLDSTTIKLVVPMIPGDTGSDIEISFGVHSASKTGFTYLRPVINTEGILSGTFFETITIDAAHLSTYQDSIQIYLGNLQADLMDAGRDHITFKIPGELDTPKPILRIICHGNEIDHQLAFNLDPIFVDAISTNQSFPGGVVTISGSGFNPDLRYATVSLQGVNSDNFIDMEINYISNQLIEFKVPYSSPYDLTTITSFNTVLIGNGAETKEIAHEIHLKKLWNFSALINSSSYYRYDYWSVVINNTPYLGNGKASDGSVSYQIFRFAYDNTLEFTNIKISASSKVVEINGRGFFYDITKTVHSIQSFNPVTGFIEKHTTIPSNLIGIKERILLSDGKDLYLLGGTNDGFLVRYSEKQNSWSEPLASLNVESVEKMYGYRIDSAFYVLVKEPANTKLFAYNIEHDNWKELPPFPGQFSSANAFAIQGNSKIFLAAANGNELWSYTPEENDWLRYPDIGDTRSGGTGFYYNNMIYIMLGSGMYNRYWSMNPDDFL